MINENFTFQSFYSKILLSLVILIEGYISIATEILTIRQLLPVVGSSVVVTSLIIGIFLLFLAWGYAAGGKNKIDPYIKLKRNFLIESIWIGIGLSYVFVIYFFYIFQKIIINNLLMALNAYLLLVIAPVIFILGQTVPIIIDISRKDLSAGIVAGNTLSLSTLGSFLGAILTSIIVLQYFGVAVSIFLISMLLLMLNIFLQPVKDMIVPLMLALCIAAMVFFINIKIEKVLFVKTNAYANYAILTAQNSHLQDKEKILLINDNMSSYINASMQAFPYIEKIKRILFRDLNLRGQKILVLGAGGFTLAAEKNNGNDFIFVDIDKQIKKVVIPEFIKSINSRFVADDARHFINANKEKFAAIVVDVYNDTKTIPAHLLSFEFINAIKKALTKHGVVVFNIIANPFLSDAYSKRIDNTINKVFRNCMIEPHIYANKPTNILYLCNNDENVDQNYYTDNLNTSTLDSFEFL